MSSETGNNQEINDLLAEFDSKSGAEQGPQNSNTTKISEISQGPESSKMVQKVIKYSGGLVKNEKQANYFLLAIVVLFMGISVYLVFFNGAKTAAPIPSPNVNANK